MGLWSMSTTLSRYSIPSTASKAAVCGLVAPFKALAAMGYKVLLIRVDLPEPETPVTQVIRPIGMVKLTFCRLLPLAPRMRSCLAGFCGRRRVGTAIPSLPDRYWPVMEASLLRISSRLPWAITWPPWTPAPGPISTIWSAARIASSSCSTTITVLPISRR